MWVRADTRKAESKVPVVDPAQLRPLVTPKSPPLRLTDKPFPPYRHVPGLTPHPVTHPDGHSHGLNRSDPGKAFPWLLPQDWSACTPYLYGLDLFNYGYHWEDHEEWEEAWHAVGPETQVGQFLQGLIQVSAALLKRHMGVHRGAANLSSKAFAKFVRLEGELRPEKGDFVYMGILVTNWRQAVNSFLAGSGAEFPFLLPQSAAERV